MAKNAATLQKATIRQHQSPGSSQKESLRAKIEQSRTDGAHNGLETATDHESKTRWCKDLAPCRSKGEYVTFY